MKPPALTAFFASFIAATALAGELPRAEPKDVGLSPEKLEKVKEFLSKAIENKQTAGAVVLVARHGKVAYLESLGKMDVEAGTAMNPEAIFRIYSMTKPLTTVAALVLYEEGKFALDDPVAKYLPDLKDVRVYKGDGEEPAEPKRAITVRDLMRHTSGFSYGFGTGTAVDKLYNKSKLMDPGDTLAVLVKKLGLMPLVCEPGTKFNYSVSTDVLARLIEVVSGKPFDEFLQERVCGPLDLRDTGFSVPDAQVSRFTTCYEKAGQGMLKVQDAPATSHYRHKPVFLSGGGGLVSTARDYARFCQMLLNGGVLDGKRILRAETVREMTKNQLPPEALPLSLMGFSQPGLGFGLGVSVRIESDSAKPDPSAGEYGWSGAASTSFWIAPKADMYVVLLQQLQPFDVSLMLGLHPLVYAAIEE